jgi:glutathione S-transferase
MKFYNSIGPNPHLVRVFAAEKGIRLDMAEVDLVKGENRGAVHLGRNPAGQLPTLQLDDGTCISEVTAICEYLEEKNPGPPLIGATPEERAETRMWVRRMDENVFVPALTGFRYSEGVKLFTGRIPIYPDAAPYLKSLARDRSAWLNAMLDGRQWFCGDRFTLADMMAGVFYVFMDRVGQTIDPENRNILAIINRMKERPSFKA